MSEQALRDQVHRVGQPLARCELHDRDKAPFGRSIPPVSVDSYCTADTCDRYLETPAPESLFPDEQTMFEFVNADDVRDLFAELDRLRDVVWHGGDPSDDHEWSPDCWVCGHQGTHNHKPDCAWLLEDQRRKADQ